MEEKSRQAMSDFAGAFARSAKVKTRPQVWKGGQNANKDFMMSSILSTISLKISCVKRSQSFLSFDKGREGFERV
ncbi:MAG: hypothetical protein LBS89_02180, partial [Zoogloeaceae bacterium]|jgi:hypothetical protein|nr:hypothetical protein [Zoogloeaceae bacterium]